MSIEISPKSFFEQPSVADMRLIACPGAEELTGLIDKHLVRWAKAAGIEKELAVLLGKWRKIPITYAGGVGSMNDLWELKELGKDRLNVTVGSALDLFGGTMEFEKVLSFCGIDKC